MITGLTEPSGLCLALIESAPLPMVAVEGSGHRVRFVNSAFCRLVGKSAEQLIGKPFFDLLPEKDECVKLLNRVFRTGKSENHTETENSETRPLFWSYSAWPVLTDERVTGVMVQVTETGEFHGMTVAMNEALTIASIRQHERADAAESAREVTAKKLAEKARLLDLTHDAIIVRGLDDRISLWSKGAEKLYGWTSEEVVGKHLHRLMQTEFPKPMEEIIADLHRDGMFCGEVTQIARDGRRVTSLCRWVLDPETESILTSYTDITGSKLAEESLRASKATLDFTLESAQVGDWDLDLITDKARRSLRHDQCFGYNEPVAEWGFEKFIQHVHPEDRTDVERKFREAATGLSDWRFECRVIWPDNSVHWIAAHGSIYRTSEGKPTRLLGIVVDITERKRAENALRESHAKFRLHAEELERFNRIAVGRELRMIELKKEVNQLCQGRGEAARYPLELEQDRKEKT